MFGQLSIVSKKMWRDLTTKTWLFLAAITLTFLFYLWNKDPQNTVLVAIWLFWWFLGWPVQLILVATLISFVLIPIISILEIPSWVQSLALWSFFLMSIGVFLQIWEYFHLSKIFTKYTRFHKKTEPVNFRNFQQFTSLESTEPNLTTIHSDNFPNSTLVDFTQKKDLTPNFTSEVLKNPTAGIIIPNINNSTVQSRSSNFDSEPAHFDIPKAESPWGNLDQDNLLPKISSQSMFHSSRKLAKFESSPILEKNTQSELELDTKPLQTIIIQSDPLKKNFSSNLKATSQSKMGNNKSKNTFTPRFNFWLIATKLVWLALILTINWAIAWLIFRLQVGTIFRDFIGLEVQSFNFNPFSSSSWLTLLFIKISGLAVTPATFWSGFFQATFAFMSTVAFLILHQLSKTNLTVLKPPLSKNLEKESPTYFILYWLLGLLYAYNPWTLERFFMGQTLVLVAQIWLLPCLYWLFQLQKALTILPTNTWPAVEKQYFLKAQRQKIGFLGLTVALAWFLLTFINLHQGFLFGILVILVNLTHLFSQIKQPPSSFYQDEEEKVNWLGLFFRHIILPIVVAGPSFWLVWSQFASTLTASSDPQVQLNKQAVLEAFSPHFLPNQNGLVRGLIGSGSWMTATFVEIYAILGEGSSIESKLQAFKLAGSTLNLANWSWYFNFWLGLATIGAVFGLIVVILFKLFSSNKLVAKARNYQFWPMALTGTLLVCLCLNFGYSLGFDSVNWIFYSWPFTLIMRESGKFYALFLAILVLLLGQKVNWHKPKAPVFEWLRLMIIMIITVSSFLAFIPATASLNYVQIPKIFASSSLQCQNTLGNSQTTFNGKLLLLPHNLYLQPSWSKVFIPSLASFYFNCPVIVPNFTQVLDSNDGQKTILQEAPQDAQINKILALTLAEKDPNVAARDFYAGVERLNIKLILADENDPETAKLFAKLRSRTTPLALVPLQSEQNITLWQVK